MEKYKIIYMENDKILSTLYVNSQSYPKIPNYDNDKYLIKEQLQVKETDINIIKVILAQKIEVSEIEVFYNNIMLGTTKILRNNAINEIELKNNFGEDKEIASSLKLRNNWDFYNITPKLGYRCEYILNANKTRLFINEEPIVFEHTTGIVKLLPDNTLSGLVPNEGYKITKLELGENNEIIFAVELDQKKQKEKVLKELQKEFNKEEFLKTNKMLINQILDDQDGKILDKNLQYFKTQIKKQDKIQKIAQTTKIDLDMSKALDNQITDLIDNVILETKAELKQQEKSNSVFKNLLSKLGFTKD